MSSDPSLLALLGAIRDGDEVGDPLDNDMLTTKLGWSPSEVAAQLEAARERMLIWGSRVGGTPAPQYVDLELTVQGRRLITAAESQPEV